jgi:hypothetical protein
VQIANLVLDHASVFVYMRLGECREGVLGLHLRICGYGITILCENKHLFENIKNMLQTVFCGCKI